MILDVNDPDILNIAPKLYDATDNEYVRNLCDGIIRGEMTVRTLRLEIQQAKEENQRIEDEIRRIDEEIQKRMTKSVKRKSKSKKQMKKSLVLKQNKMP